MDYSNLLKRSWAIVWNNKFMFVLGFLAALGGGSGGGNFNYRSSSPSSSDNLPNFDLPPNFPTTFEGFWAQYGIWIVVGILFLIVISILFWLLSLIGKAGMIEATARLDRGETVTLGDAFAAGSNQLGRMAGLSLLLHLPFILLFVFMMLGLFFTVGAAAFEAISNDSLNGLEQAAGAGFGLFFACMAGLICLSIPLGLVINLVHPFAQRGLILQGQNITDSIRHGWQVVRDNTGDVFVLIILFVVLGFFFGIATAIVLVPIAAAIFLPLILPIINGAAFTISTIILSVIGGVVLGVVGAAINGIMRAFRSTAVTLAYQQFINKTVSDKLGQVT